MHKACCLAALALTLLAPTARAQRIAPAARAALPTAQPAAFEAHVRYLAYDRLRGRLPGTPGYTSWRLTT